MRVMAINGSPRVDGNTATLLNHALEGAKSAGAEVELVHLYDLVYRGCVSCFACKRKGARADGCAFRDGLTPVLERALKADALVLGSPVYFSDVTGAMRGFLERLLFPFVNYSDHTQPKFSGRIDSAFFFTMNMPEQFAEYGRALFEGNSQIVGHILKGKSGYLASYDTCQFDDYGKYEAAMFDEVAKRRRRETQFPLDCQKAFETGRQLAGG